MARAVQTAPKAAEVIKAVAALATAAMPEAGPDLPRFIRLTGSGTVFGGRLLPVGKALEIGVDISEALASARLASGSAEEVQASAITAKALREAVAAMVSAARSQADAFLAQIADADDKTLLDLVEATRPDFEPEIAQLHLAVEAHRFALDAEPDPSPQGGGDVSRE